jgi:hypothetical protein
VKYHLKRYPDGGFEYSPVARVESPRDGFDIVDALPDDIKAKMPKPGDREDPMDDIKARLDKLEAKVKP